MQTYTYSDIYKSKKEKSRDGKIILVSVFLTVGYFGGHIVYWYFNR